jgi:hypothetical protein
MDSRRPFYDWRVWVDRSPLYRGDKYFRVKVFDPAGRCHVWGNIHRVWNPTYSRYEYGSDRYPGTIKSLRAVKQMALLSIQEETRV